MSLPKMTTPVNNISQLDDLPNAVGGLSAAELKARFDKAGGDIQTFLNETLVPAIEQMGVDEGTARDAAIQAAIDALELDTTVENLQKAIVAAETRAKEYADTKDTANLTAAKQYADSAAASAASAAVTAAASDATTKAAAALTNAKSYTDTKADAILAEAERVSGSDAQNAETAAKQYADKQDAATLTAAKEYTDGKIPSKLPNPQKLKFTGAVTGEYDGSTEKTINIPAGGSDVPAVLGNLGAKMGESEAGAVPVYAGDEAWTIEKIIKAYTGDNDLSGYIPDTAWVNALMSAAAVRYDKEQGLTTTQERTARSNIGAKISCGVYWSEKTHTYDAIAAASYGEMFICRGYVPVAGMITPLLMIPGENSRGKVSISVLDGAGAWYEGVINLESYETSLAKLSAPMPVSAAADAGKLLQVGADGAAEWGDKLPTALKNPKALTFTGAATGTYDGSEALAVNIPNGYQLTDADKQAIAALVAADGVEFTLADMPTGGSGGSLKALSSVVSYIGIPAADLPENGVVWVSFGVGGNMELYTGTITIQDAGIATNDMLAITNGTVNPLDQVAWVSDGIAFYGMTTSNYRGVYMVVSG